MNSFSFHPAFTARLRLDVSGSAPLHALMRSVEILQVTERLNRTKTKNITLKHTKN